MAGEVAEAFSPRWKGKRGRMEVWYATLSDPETGTGFWVHYERVAPVQGPVHVHGWISVFEEGVAPVTRRFGPVEGDGRSAEGAERWLSMDGETWIGPGCMAGRAEEIGWDLQWSDEGPVLWTFPRWAWNSDLLPGAQVVPAPDARFRGWVTLDGRRVELCGSRGAVAHISSHGSARRWGWLHADLGGGDVLEVVAAAPQHPALRKVPALGFVQLRMGGVDWPGDALLAAPFFRPRIGLPSWGVDGRLGLRRLRVEVGMPPERCVALRYEDPDGEEAVCTNTERADVQVVLERKVSGRWEREREWRLDARGHAEVGLRAATDPPAPPAHL